MSKKIAILGLGWLGLPLAKALNNDGLEITGSTTSSQKLMQLLQSQFSVKIIELQKNLIKGSWKNFINDSSVLVINIPPGRKTEQLESYPDKIQQIIQHSAPELKVIFVSSTSVYGDHREIVDEHSPAIPEKASGKVVLKAETILKDYFKENLTILRFAGLFGKDRHPGRFLSADKPLSNPNGKINLIHQDDCIQLIKAIIAQDCFGETINGCADIHPLRSAFYTKAALSLDLPKPTFDEKEKASGKVVDNSKSKKLLGINYIHPNPETAL